MEPCIPVEHLAHVAALPAGDPGRAHLERCTRCQALAAMLADFAAPAPSPAEAGFERADANLLETIAELTGVPTPRAAASRGEGARAPAPRRERTAWWDGWFGAPAVRLAGALAVVVAVGFAGVNYWRARTAPPVMRAAGGDAEAGDFTSQPAEAGPGGVDLCWTAVPGATGYRVVFLDDALREIAHLEPTTATNARLERTALPAGLVHGRSVGWQVEALGGTGRTRSTATRTLLVP